MTLLEVEIVARVHSMEEARKLVEWVKRTEKECRCHCTLRIRLY